MSSLTIAMARGAMARGFVRPLTINRLRTFNMFVSDTMASNTVGPMAILGLPSMSIKPVPAIIQWNSVRPMSVMGSNTPFKLVPTAVARNFIRTNAKAKKGGDCGPSAKLKAGWAKLKKNQKHFQKEDGKLIWQKGEKDDMLYKVTWGLCILGLLLNFKLYFGYILFN